MRSVNWSTKIVRGTIFETERGLFHIRYSADTADAGIDELPAYQIATCVSEAKQKIEQIARNLGFDVFMWEYAHPFAALKTPTVGSDSSRPGVLNDG